MKALSVKQPYATLIILGIKHLETRGWRPSRTTGPVAIHASKEWGRAEQALAMRLVDEGVIPAGTEMAFGAVLGVVEIEHVWPSAGLPRGPLEESLGDFSRRWAWRLRVTERFPEAIPAKGALGLWEWTNQHEAER